MPPDAAWALCARAGGGSSLPLPSASSSPTGWPATTLPGSSRTRTAPIKNLLCALVVAPRSKGDDGCGWLWLRHGGCGGGVLREERESVVVVVVVVVLVMGERRLKKGIWK